VNGVKKTGVERRIILWQA